MDAMTPGIQNAIAENKSVAKWSVQALAMINRKGGNPSMIVGRDCKKPMLEDDGRTLILPLKGQRCYACLNGDSGGVTLMLADEY